MCESEENKHFIPILTYTPGTSHKRRKNLLISVMFYVNSRFIPSVIYQYICKKKRKVRLLLRIFPKANTDVVIAFVVVVVVVAF